MINATELRDQAKKVLDANFCGQWTQPAPGRYPHQWLWDSCFIAIGLRHYDPKRAAAELVSTLRGQWDNGMIPHMIYAPTRRGRKDARLWNLKLRSKTGVATSPITQPPVMAIATELVAEKLSESDRDIFLKTMIPAIIEHHKWMYAERQSDDTGLITVVHPWESGLDNSPPWMETMRELKKTFTLWGFATLIPTFGSSKERVTYPDAARMLTLANVLYENGYHSDHILKNSPVIIQDLAFNAILVEANDSIVRLAKSAGIKLDSDLIANMAQTRGGMSHLYDSATGEYYSRNARTGELIIDSTVATFLPIGLTTDKVQTKRLLEKLDSPDYKAVYPVPSIARSHPLFSNQRYWQGPSWINMNWLIIRGLERAGEQERADKLREQTLSLGHFGMFEYYDPDTGTGHGAANFSWTAALLLDLLAKVQK